MPNYNPWAIPLQKLNSSTVQAVGSLLTDFQPLEPARYNFGHPPRPARDAWEVVVPKHGPVIGDLPLLIKSLIKATWKFAEPAWDNIRGHLPNHVGHGIAIGTHHELRVNRGVFIGTRGSALSVEVPKPVGITYARQVRPTVPKDANGNLHGVESTFPTDTAIASDWKLFEAIPRTNAVTFRGDSRSPNDVIAKARGFYPPNSRTDRYYLENNIYAAFKDYLKRRYDRDLTQAEFLDAVDRALPAKEYKSLIVDYLMWRKITEKEAVHLGRMVETECLKGYISTAKSIDTSLFFATGYGSRPGWLYLTVVQEGFMVPAGAENYWGSEEAEIAQWGPVPAERIVGFVHVEKTRSQTGPFSSAVPSAGTSPRRLNTCSRS